MNFVQATAKYEAWLGRHLRILEEDLEYKHEQMRKLLFPFFRATYYRWAQIWPEICKPLSAAPSALAVGDLHAENFGTWRDAEGRLIWGINDFDEAWPMPYTNDLVRLAASIDLAATEGGLKIRLKDAAEVLVKGYKDCLKAGGHPLVLAESNLELRTMAAARLKDPGVFWRKLSALPDLQGPVPKLVLKSLSRAMPERKLKCRIAHRRSGLGSLGRERFVAIAEWHGGAVAREAKALAPSAASWTHKTKGTPAILYQQILDRSIRCLDPFVHMRGRWILRRLAPDCSRIPLADLPAARDEALLLYFMGWETANVHIGSAKPKTLLTDLQKRKGKWLHDAAALMVKATEKDWREWKS